MRKKKLRGTNEVTKTLLYFGHKSFSGGSPFDTGTALFGSRAIGTDACGNGRGTGRTGRGAGRRAGTFRGNNR